MSDFDSPWKEALDYYLEWFMALCFPDVYHRIDWAVKPIMLDKELQQIAPQSETGKRFVDKLVEVRLLSGEVEWILIHLEIQNQRDSDFPKRMYVYFYRISDKYNKRVVSLAMLGDGDPDWRPNRFVEDTFGCRVEFSFPIVKLLDFEADLVKLELSPNPFAAVVLAHLMTMRTSGSPQDRYAWKLRLVRPLYERGRAVEEVRQLFKVIDWMMELPTDVEIEFRSELHKIEEEMRMPYVTSVERLARQEGTEDGLRQGIAALLEARFGDAGIKLASELPHQASVDFLKDFLNACKSIESVESLREGWIPKSETPT